MNWRRGFSGVSPLHSLTGGVTTLQAPGSWRACVWLTVMPNWVAPPFRTWQRHCGDVLTTEARPPQQLLEGVASTPVMYPRQDARLRMDAVQPLVCALASLKKTAPTMAREAITANSVFGAMTTRRMGE